MSDDNPYKYEIIQELYFGVLKSYEDCVIDKNEVLTLARKLVEWQISTYGDNDSATINLLQVHKRIRELNISERSKLLEIVNSGEDARYKAAACLLLDNQEQAEYHLSKLSEEDRKAFAAWPIYYFFDSESNNSF